MKINIEIESRESITARAKNPFPEGTAVISISDVGDDSVVFENQPEYLLELRFDDVSYQDIEEAVDEESTKDEISALSTDLNMITDEQADEIASIVISAWQGFSKLLICQCEHGQSRSAGVAAAVRQFTRSDGIEVFADARYYPNKLVYKKTLSALSKIWHTRRIALWI